MYIKVLLLLLMKMYKIINEKSVIKVLKVKTFIYNNVYNNQINVD